MIYVKSEADLVDRLVAFEPWYATDASSLKAAARHAAAIVFPLVGTDDAVRVMRRAKMVRNQWLRDHDAFTDTASVPQIDNAWVR